MVKENEEKVEREWREVREIEAWRGIREEEKKKGRRSREFHQCSHAHVHARVKEREEKRLVRGEGRGGEEKKERGEDDEQEKHVEWERECGGRERDFSRFGEVVLRERVGLGGPCHGPVFGTPFGPSFGLGLGPVSIHLVTVRFGLNFGLS